MQKTTIFDSAYDPHANEQRIYELWEDNKDFAPRKAKDGSQPFVIMIPPPNVTGSLHMGHALNATLTDILIRRARHQGRETLWLPGTDHAGIATQNKVEKKLAKEGKRRHDLGREKFLDEVWQWKQEHGDRIKLQLQRLGASCDWSRERFTMDEDYSLAVQNAFNHYRERGWIYEGERLVNWCPRCASAISDLEVNHRSQKTNLTFIKYPLKEGGFITVATTRPETMLGDTAVAVNPKDKRYQSLIGKSAILPLVDREIKIIGDTSVEMGFGSGAVKVTPGHAEADWEIKERHNLEVVKAIDERGRINDIAPAYTGMKSKEAREKICEDLTKLGLIEKTEEIEHNLALCDRCDTPIEPLVSKQWFVKMGELAKPAIEAVKNGEIKFYPASYKRVYLDWMENLKDWCISRQLWWGHPIPIKGSEDVLDTWFSSALWPFATLGWPDTKSEDLKRYYPTATLLTAKDIIYLWVARMIFSGYELMGAKPFSDVYLHPTILNKEGKRMSKSLGTGLDPMDLIEEYGADATRFGLVWQTLGLQQYKFSQEPVLTGKKFANKLWNASRFVLLQLEAKPSESAQEITPADKAVLSALSTLKRQTTIDLRAYRFGQPLQDIYHFFWHDFCDSYLEQCKAQLKDEKLAANTQAVLLHVLRESLTLLNPFMPFVTEAIWQELYERELVADQRLINYAE